MPQFYSVYAAVSAAGVELEPNQTASISSIPLIGKPEIIIG